MNKVSPNTSHSVTILGIRQLVMSNFIVNDLFCWLFLLLLGLFVSFFYFFPSLPIFPTFVSYLIVSSLKFFHFPY